MSGVVWKGAGLTWTSAIGRHPQPTPCRAPQAVGGVRKLQAHPFFRTINGEDLKEGRVQLPLALRETLFEVARQGGGGGELQGAAMVGSQQPGGQPSKWLEDF